MQILKGKVLIMILVFRHLYLFLDSFSFLLLSALGLSIIYGMMGIINQAHGEFIMLGAYFTSLLSVALHIPFIISIFLGAILTGFLGLLLDRTIICRLYSRPLDSIVVTWGISLILSQGIRIILGNSVESISTPLGSFTIGNEKFSTYRMVLVAVAVITLMVVYYIFNHTEFGLKARATMQRSDIAKSLGVNTDKMYAATFFIGSFLAGLTGGLYSPTMMVVPTMGTSFNMQAFVTVIVGGSNPILGSFLSSALLGIVNSELSGWAGSFAGQIGLLIMAIIFIRICPLGVSGLVDRLKAVRR